jgi:hypothetical protein
VSVHPAGALPAGGSVTIGATVSGGTANRILFIDHLGQLAVTAAMQFDDGTNRVALSSLSLSSSLIIANGATPNPPDVGFSADPDTGIYSPGADKFGIGLGGVAVFELGNATPDSDQTMTMGRLRIDARATDNVYISHRDMTSTSQHALRITASGATSLNCASGQSTSIQHANTTRISVNSTGLGFFGATAVAQQNITGAKGGNAALADLLTKLALLGLITDSTT